MERCIGCAVDTVRVPVAQLLAWCTEVMAYQSMAFADQAHDEALEVDPPRRRLTLDDTEREYVGIDVLLTANARMLSGLVTTPNPKGHPVQHRFLLVIERFDGYGPLDGAQASVVGHYEVRLVMAPLEDFDHLMEHEGVFFSALLAAHLLSLPR